MHRPGRDGGPSHHGLYEPEVLGGTPGLRGRPAHSELDASSSPVQQDWRITSPSLHPCTPWLAASLPWKVENPIPACSVVWNGGPDDRGWSSQHGHFSFDGCFNVCPTVRAAAVEDFLIDTTCGRDHGQLESADEPRGASTSFENRRLRCECPVRLSLYDLLGFEDLQCHEGGRSGGTTLEFQLQPVLGSFQGQRQKAGPALDSIPHSTQWAVDRQEQEVQVAARGAETRTMEEHKIDSPLREICTTCKKLGTGEPAIQRLLFDLRGGNRGHHSFKKNTSEFSFPRRSAKGQYVADLFSGNGGVAAACERLGFRSNEWDIRHGHHCDLTRRKVLRRLKVDIKQGKVLAAMLAPPCDSFSVARDRTKVIRTKVQPWGVDDSLLTEKEKQKVSIGNACFASCFSLIRILNLYKVPWILENPASSKCWHLPFLKKLEQQEHAVSIVSDFCQYGTAWRKRTKFLCGNIAPADLHRIDRRCNNSSICSRSGRPHFQLTGKGPNNVNWTTIAQPYPKQLCDGLAYSLTCVYHYNTSQY